MTSQVFHYWAYRIQGGPRHRKSPNAHGSTFLGTADQNVAQKCDGYYTVKKQRIQRNREACDVIQAQVSRIKEKRTKFTLTKTKER